jgi:ubiquinone/menaquinone biosynthesis C-methylase UbiE
MAARTTPPESLPQRIELMYRLTAPAVRQAVAALRLPSGSHGLDAGCGAGCHVDLLLQHVGPSGRLTAVDISEENLTWARDHHRGGSPVDWAVGDIRKLPFPDASFDWVWCADTLWPGAVSDDPAEVLREFRRVSKPGGVVALVYWSNQTLLPGYPELEARLNEAFLTAEPYLTGVAPELHFLRAASWLRIASFAEPQARTFLAGIQPPRDPLDREALAACFSMFWGQLAGQVSSADWDSYARLCDPGSPEFIADAPGFYAFVTYTMFSARVPTSAIRDNSSYDPDP